MQSHYLSLTDVNVPMYDTLMRAASRSRNWYRRIVTAQLVLFLVASLLSSFSYRLSYQHRNVDVTLLGAAACFALAIIFQVFMSVSRWEEQWKDLIEAGEKVRSLAFAYAVGGDPFPLGTLDNSSTDLAFQAALGEIVDSVAMWLPQRGATGGDAQVNITHTMRMLRAITLAERIEVYRSRVGDQLMWYQAKARRVRQNNRLWNTVTLALQALALAALVAQSVGLLHLSIFGIASAIGGASATYAQNGRFSALSREYENQYRALAKSRAKLESLTSGHPTEPDWGPAVAATEQQLLAPV